MAPDYKDVNPHGSDPCSELEQKSRECQEILERFELATVASTAGIFDWDISSDRVFFCGRIRELLGYPPDEFPESMDGFWDMVHPDDLPAARLAVDRHLKERVPCLMDLRLRRRSGEYRWFHARGQASLDDNGHAVRMTGSLADVTDRKLTEQKLARSEERFRLMMEQSPLAIEILSPEGQIVRYNKAWLKLWGINEAEAAEVRAGYNMRSDPQLEEMGLRPVVEKAFSGEAVVLPLIHYSGDRVAEDLGLDVPGARTIWIQSHLFPLKDESGKIVNVINTYMDVTAEKTTEQQLARSRDQFCLMMKQSPLATAVWSPDGKLVCYNKAWLKQWNVDEKEAAEIVANYNFLADPQVRELGVLPLLERAFSGEAVILPPIYYRGEKTAVDIDVGLANPNSKWIQVHLYSIKNENGKIANVVSANVDITDLKLVEKEASEQREALARIDRASSMGHLTGSISHELNQPLTGILSNAEAAGLLLAREDLDREELADIISSIISDTKRAGEVIRSLREVYREQKGEFLPVDVNRIIVETMDLMHSEFIMQDVAASHELAASVPEVSGNRVQIQQVLLNVIMNGMQAMSDYEKQARQLHVKTIWAGNEVMVQVEDSGPGIDADKIDHIFEPLATWKPGGTGMGLAISSTIIKAHGGRMLAENRPEGGARVGFAIPVKKDE